MPDPITSTVTDQTGPKDRPRRISALPGIDLSSRGTAGVADRAVHLAQAPPRPCPGPPHVELPVQRVMGDHGRRAAINARPAQIADPDLDVSVPRKKGDTVLAARLFGQALRGKVSS